MKHILFISSKQVETYHPLIQSARLPDLTIASKLTSDVDILFGEPNLIKEALASLPALKWVQSTWAGVEPLLDPVLRRDYVLTNARGVFGRLMSEYVFGYLLANERKILQRASAQRNKRWDDSLTGWLRGKTIGLLGVGSIGAEIARTARFFEMSVRGYTRESEKCTDVDNYYHGRELHEFAEGVDYLVAILPSTKDTLRIVDDDLLNKLPPNAVFINVGRGSLVDESALIEALNNQRISGAVLDVFEQEPLPMEHPFWETKNLIMTFHTSAPSLPADLARLFIENYLLLFDDKPLKYLIDFDKGY